MTNRNTNPATATITLLYDIFLQYYHHIITLVEAVARSSLGKRTFQRRYKAWREGGPEALIHGNTGRPSANRLSPELRETILDLIVNKYFDFGPIMNKYNVDLIHLLTLEECGLMRAQKLSLSLVASAVQSDSIRNSKL